jgi:hypothetical protein
VTRPFRAVLVGAVLTAVLAPVAEARQVPRGAQVVEAIDEPPTTLEQGQSTTGVVTAALSSNFGRYFINTQTNFVTVRGVPRSFSVGSAASGWGIDVYKPRLSSNGYHWGYVDGAGKVAKCVYVEAALLGQATQAPTRDCSRTGAMHPSAYMRYWNGNTIDENCWVDNKGQWRCDGSNITVNCPAGWNNGGSQFYANVQPWRGTAENPTDNSGWIGNGALVKWRYVTKGGGYVMVRVPWITANVPNQQDWGFIPKACLPQLTGGVTPTS